MGSRLKENPEQTFYWFFEATCPVARDRDPGVQFQFPEDFSDEESCQTLPRFCFPYDIQKVRDGVAVQHFTFVLTDLEGSQRFGFCRLTTSTHTCLCILSYLPWFEVFYKLLNNLADYLKKGQMNEMKALLAALYKQPIPLMSGSVTLQMMCCCLNLSLFAVDILRARAECCFVSHVLAAHLHPCTTTTSVGLLLRVRGRALEEVVILNVDSNTLETPFDDLKRIPSDVVSGLKLCLKRQAVSPGCGVSRAFLKAQALLFGGYRNALQCQQDGEMLFNEAVFLEHKSSSMRHFLQSAVHLQFFKQFIDSRMDILNKGKEPGDLFEEEIHNCDTTEGE
ncbi:unnamed protein product, partial [Tetraodon nigroviridis]